MFAGGTLGFVADAALAGAVFTTLPKSTALLSSDLSINFLEPAWPASERLIATGTVIHVGRRQGLSEARVEDARGTLLAHATSRCVLQPLPFDPPEPPEAFPPVTATRSDTPDPYLRPVEGEVVPQAVWDETSGLDLVQLWHKGERPPSPNCSLLGLRFVDVAEGSVTLAMPASLWFCTGFGTFYGGALIAFADTAINTAVTTTLPPGTVVRHARSEGQLPPARDAGRARARRAGDRRAARSHDRGDDVPPGRRRREAGGDGDRERDDLTRSALARAGRGDAAQLLTVPSRCPSG